MSIATEPRRITPTLSQVRNQYENDLQLVGLQILADAARSSRPADYIGAMLDTVRTSYGAREVTYLVQFITGLAEERGLLGA